MFLQDCVKAANERKGALPAVAVTGGRGPVRCRSLKPLSQMMRVSRHQGAPYKCPLIRESLWNWFVGIRRSVCERLSPKMVLMKARSLADEIMAMSRATGNYIPMPILDKHWLLRWRRDKGIVFRKPNQRFKTSRQTMIVRLRAMWLNKIRVRHLARIFLGHDMSDRIYSIDEKPMHFNEGASKNKNTLEIQGAPAVKLKENHTASRQRLSVMTWHSPPLRDFTSLQTTCGKIRKDAKCRIWWGSFCDLNKFSAAGPPDQPSRIKCKADQNVVLLRR